MKTTIIHLGTVSYQQGLKHQLSATESVRHDPSQAFILTCEHSPHVITLGRHASIDSIVASDDELQRKGVEVIRSSRGGDATVHYKGQLVIYPILNLKLIGMGIKQFVCSIEQAIIDTLAELDIHAQTLENLPGVWMRKTYRYLKIAALGFSVKKGLTGHGLAVNIDTDLTRFDLIKPCGLDSKNYGVTSLCHEIKMSSPQPLHLTDQLTARLCQQIICHLGL